MVNGKKPYLGGIQEFGVAAYVKDLKAGKLNPHAQKGHFIGYDSESKGFHIYWPEKWTISIEQNVVFNPNDLLMEDDLVIIEDKILNEGEKGKVIRNDSKDEDIKNDENRKNDNKSDLPGDKPIPKHQEHIPNPPLTSTQPPKQSRHPEILDEPEPNTSCGFRVRPQPGKYVRMNLGLEPLGVNAVIVEDDVEAAELGGVEEYTFVALMGNEPALLDDVLPGAHANEWQATRDKEMSCLESAQTWELTLPPVGIPIIPCTEVFKEETGPDGEITEWRLRIVGGGHKQKKSVNYDETFSLAAKMPTVCIMLADTAQHDWEIHQIDIKSAYLNAPLDEIVYMHPPKRYLKPGQEGMVCRLLKCLYGLKQVGRGWHKEMLSAFDQIGFPKSGVDHSLFVRCSESEQIAVAVVTDDMAIAASSMDAVWLCHLRYQIPWTQ
jgi:hypothetical protein